MRIFPLISLLFLLLLPVLAGRPVFASALSDAVAAMKPGTFRPVNALNSITVFRMAPLMEPIFAYANSGCWDPHTRQMLFGGAPHCPPAQFAAYRESDNNWRLESMPAVGCHAYDHQTIDTAGIFYWMNYGDAVTRRFDTRANAWVSSLPASEGSYGSLDYFPEINGLVRTYGGSVYCYQFDKGSWQTLVSANTGNIHTIAQYCPAGKMLLFGGGNSFPRALYKLDKNLSITSLRPAPFDLGVNSGSLITADPATGRIIVIRSDSLYGYDDADDSWHGIVACPAVIRAYLGSQAGVIPISTYGVIAILSISSYPVLLYKNADMNAADDGRGAAVLPAGEFGLFPNPVSKGRSLRVDARGVEKLSVYAPDGRRIAGLVPGKAWRANVPAGVYLIRGGKGGKAVSRRLIVLN